MSRGDGIMAGEAPPSPYAAPIKRSITIAGHQTAISLEPIFWDALKVAAQQRGVPLNALVADIDVKRMAVDTPPNLTSAIRCWLMSKQVR